MATIYKNSGPIYLTKAQYDALTNKVIGQEYRIVDDPWIEAAAIAVHYSSSSTYAKDVVVEYNGRIYKCKNGITEAEEWTADHWTDLGALASIVSSLKDSKVSLSSLGDGVWTISDENTGS